MPTIRRIFAAVFASPTTRATAVLNAYRVAVDTGDYANAERAGFKFGAFGRSAQRAALDAVYADVLPSNRIGYAFDARPAVRAVRAA